MRSTAAGSGVLPCLVAAAGLLLSLGCAKTETVGASGSPAVSAPPPAPVDTSFTMPPSVGPISAPGQVAEPMPGGTVDWSGRTVRARGSGVLDPGNANKAQARLMAERAAVVVAQRNLLEIAKSVRVDSDTRIQNYMTEYDVVYSNMDGIVKAARQPGPARYDSVAGMVEVELEIPLYGDSSIQRALQPVLAAPDVPLTAPSLSPQARDFLRRYSGLVLDGGTTGLQPAMFLKIYDETGNLLLDTRDYLKYAGRPDAYAGQFVSTIDQMLAMPEFAREPLVLKVKEIRGKLGTDIVLGRGDADKVRWLKDGFKLLMDTGRFVLKLAL
jgi:hypothetical protein